MVSGVTQVSLSGVSSGNSGTINGVIRGYSSSSYDQNGVSSGNSGSVSIMVRSGVTQFILSMVAVELG